MSVTPAKTRLDDFMEWWRDHGQYVRSGGGEYEQSFAFAAYMAALNRTTARSADADPTEAYKQGYEDGVTAAADAIRELALTEPPTPS